MKNSKTILNKIVETISGRLIDSKRKKSRAQEDYREHKYNTNIQLYSGNGKYKDIILLVWIWSEGLRVMTEE